MFFISIEEYGLNPDSVSTTEKSTLTWHRIVEAMKFAYAKRSSLGDPDKESQSFKDGIDEVGLLNIVTFDVEKVPQHILKSHACIFSLFPRHKISSYYQKKMNNIIYFIAGQEYDIIKLC